MIEFKNISKNFIQNNESFTALNDINLNIKKGDIFGIIGHSGAGKSTLIRIINYLEKPTSGEIIVDKIKLSQVSIKELNAIKKKIGMIFQHFNLLESKTVRENIEIPLLLNRTNEAEREARIDTLLAYVGLSDKANSYPIELSGGQKQRVAIARALANKPKILLCDEATSALDPTTTLSILDLLRQINQDHQVTIVLVTHEMKVVQYICNNIAVMDKGNIVEQGATEQLFKNPQQNITKNFINAVINENVPLSILNNLHKYAISNIFKLEFLDNSAQNTVINDLLLKINIKINILFANMTEIKDEIVGYMFVSLIGAQQDIDAAIAYLRTQGVRVNKAYEQGEHHV